MSLFNLKIPTSEKPVSHHPWEKVIKDVYSGKMKYAHNSVKNPKYPKKEEKKPPVPEGPRVRFTIVGIRVTKEFIYCATLVKGLHKYRRKNFDSPIIRGVTTVEWPIVLNDLKLRYGGLAFCLNSQVAVVMDDKFLGGENELKELIESKYVYHLSLDYYKEGVSQFASYVRSSGLYSDIVPLTCDNFLRLCKQTKGGYGGTPVHRIVKDGWIQCGGFGLKDNKDLGCENFIVPHDRRGVLCMANDGRHVDCSTQFFILLQPAMWMAYKYVAFGQLIDGEETLKKIERVPTFYESPLKDIKIYRSGIFNMDCQDIMINKKSKEYIFGHIDDLYVIGEIFYEELLERVFALITVRAHQVMTGEEMLGEEMKGEGDLMKDSKRFMQKKEDIEKQLGKSQVAIQPLSEQELVTADEYEYEYEGMSYKHESIGPTASLVVKPEKPFYLPLTDVPDPNDTDSTFNLRKFVRGDYCLESDLDKKVTQEAAKSKISYPSEIVANIDTSTSESESSLDLDSDEEKEIKKYLSQNVDRVSFAGGIVKNIARGTAKYNIFDDATKSDLVITDEVLRRVRTMSADVHSKHTKKLSVSIAKEDADKVHHQIKRRQTGFVRPADLEKIRLIAKLNAEKAEEEEDDEDEQGSRHVSMSVEHEAEKVVNKIKRRQTGFVRPAMLEKVHIFGQMEEENDDEDDANRYMYQFCTASFSWKHESGENASARVATYIYTYKAVSVRMADENEKPRKSEQPKIGFLSDDMDRVLVFEKFLDTDDDDDSDDEDYNHAERNRKVSMSIVEDEQMHHKIKRRPTGFPGDFAKMRMLEDFDDDDDDEQQKRQVAQQEDEAKHDTKRRQTGFVRPDELEKIRIIEDSDDDDDTDDDDYDKKNDRPKRKVSVSVPDDEDDKIHHDIKRRQTGFVRPQDLAKIRVIEDSDEDDSDDKRADMSKRKVSVSVPEDEDNKVHHDIKRRQTGFVRPEDLAKIRLIQDSDDDDDSDDDRNDRSKRKVSVSVPDNEDDKVHHDIKRRQTGFVRKEDLEKIRVIQDSDDDADDDSDGETNDRSKRKVSVSVPDDEDDKVRHDIKRRQTGFVRPEDLEKIRVIEDSDDEDSDYDEERSKRKISVSIVADEEVHHKIKRRQTGFIRPSDLPKIDMIDEDEEDSDNEENDRSKRKVSVSIVADEEKDHRDKIKRRQTGFFRPSDLVQLMDSLEEEEEEEQKYEDAGANRNTTVLVSFTAKEEVRHKKGLQAKRGFVHQDDLGKVTYIERSDERDNDYNDDRHLGKVRIVPSQPRTASQERAQAHKLSLARRPTGYVRPTMDVEDSEIDFHRPSVLKRLYDDVAIDEDEDIPTLKDYKPKTELQKKSLLLTPTMDNFLNTEESKEKYYFRPSMLAEANEHENVLNLQHGKKLARKISSDYVKTIDQIEQRQEASIRSVEFAKSRPAMSVTDYQTKNSKLQEELRNSFKHQVKNQPPEDSTTVGLRLPGDTPLYTENSVEAVKPGADESHHINILRSKLSRIAQSHSRM